LTLVVYRIHLVEFDFCAAKCEKCRQISKTFGDVIRMIQRFSLLVRRVLNRNPIDKIKDDFLSIAAHEIRTPITVLKARAQLAKIFYDQGRFTGDIVEHTLDSLVSESDRLARLCTNIIDIVRLESSSLQIFPAKLELGALVNSIVELFKARSKIHEFEILLDLKEMPIYVWADKDRVSQILFTLFGNAVRYSPAGGKISVKLSLAQDKASISIKDQGLGIEKEKLFNIFARYYQAHNSGLKGQSGLGLGLYLAKNLLLEMGGDISVKSEGVGLGSEFTISLPLVARERLGEVS
jgi:signal transduction histidine kinase